VRGNEAVPVNKPCRTALRGSARLKTQQQMDSSFHWNDEALL